MTYEEAKLFIRNFTNYEESFSTETLRECLKSEKIDDWTKKHNVDINYYQGQYDNYPRIQDNHIDYVFKNIRQDGLSATACYRTNSYTFLLPCEHQLKEGNFLLKCIHTEIPELNQFNFKCYHFDRLNTLIFLETDVKINGNNTSLYIPIDALLKRDVDTIVSTHTEYHKSYYNPNSTEWRHLGKKREKKITEWQNLSLSVIDQPIVKTFLSILKYLNCQLEIDDFEVLLKAGIGAMREYIYEKQKKKANLLNILNQTQEKIKKEWELFEKDHTCSVIENPKISIQDNLKVYTKMNLYMFFCNQGPLELWESLKIIQDRIHNISELQLLKFLELDNILECLYNFKIKYDSEFHTDTRHNIIYMIEEFINEELKNNKS